MLDRFTMQAIFATGTASAGLGRIKESSYIDTVAPQSKESLKSPFYNGSA
jgi:hypothetical protein